MILITGSSGLIGSEAVEFFDDQIIGIDNNMRERFFGTRTTKPTKKGYIHYNLDIRGCKYVFQKYNTDIELIIHTAAQPSHDYAANYPLLDFAVNAEGSLKLLEWARQYCPEAVFVYCSTNKVYGDCPNRFSYYETDTRYEFKQAGCSSWQAAVHNLGFNEMLDIDRSIHSLFGCSKLAGDLYTQEYGRYFGMKTGVFRGGCLTGPNHQGAEQHGFLSYLMKCCKENKPYTIYGYKGKQVRDNIHSYDLVNAFYHFYTNPKCGEVYNIGGGRHSNCSVLEAIELCEKATGNKLEVSYSEQARKGDHKWWISDCSKFKRDYSEWEYSYTLNDIINDLAKY